MAAFLFQKERGAGAPRISHEDADSALCSAGESLVFLLNRFVGGGVRRRKRFWPL
jgi:CRP-like cAMP-binding protein